MIKIECVTVGPIHTNCYLVEYDGRTIVIDPGAEPQKIIRKITELKLTPAAVVNTHGHWDHIMADTAVKNHYKIPLFTPEADRAIIEGQKDFYHIGELQVDHWYTDTLDIDLPIKLIQTPGHTPGSTCLLLEDVLFSGDMMFAGGYLGRTDFPGGDEKAIQKSLQKLLALPDNVKVLPGHDEASTIGQERLFYAKK
ncbi:putative Zn-dependent hydrolases of the beta-lactamase fold [Candidatus Termititenax spirochaetophilus]|uniref:Zn-dependent hydrolases of the beta-lactamase fold n=1 Tax=Candidatus Termititenax spirochaetophilus TaxID=2218522 RepID=A0A388T9U0_9BACT|nr:putative Zn-dependent hydrolases of the beta-lactamase fold [Candidatus Termititenax spirochaetophilus]